MQLCPVRSCGLFGAERLAKYDGAPTTAIRRSGPIRTAIMSFATWPPERYAHLAPDQRREAWPNSTKSRFLRLPCAYRGMAFRRGVTTALIQWWKGRDSNPRPRHYDSFWIGGRGAPA